MSVKLRRTLARSGGSLVLRIPKDIERIMDVKAEQEVDTWIENNRIVIELVKKKKRVN